LFGIFEPLILGFFLLDVGEFIGEFLYSIGEFKRH